MSKFYETGDTICALATPAGSGALALVRVSGASTYDVASDILAKKLPAKARLGGKHFYRTLRLGDDVNCDAVVICYVAPNSYTGEDAIEISLPGNMLLVERLLNRLQDAGARLAEPGEFTFRAYLNGKLDLAQAEAVNGAIRAGNDTVLRLTLNELSGEASRRIEGWLARINSLLARIEVVHDYPGDVEETPTEEVKPEISALTDELQAHLEFYRRHHRMRGGLKVVILGPPNVGKSTLFNKLLGYERAIVTEEPGTTRDYLEEPLLLGGIRLALVDTAGLRRARELVEMMGVERAEKLLGEADALILVEEVFHFKTHGSDPLPRLKAMRRRAEEVGLEVLPVISKLDTVSDPSERGEIRATAERLGGLALAAKQDEGLDGVRAFLAELARVQDTGVRFLLTERQGALVEKATYALACALRSFADGLAMDATAVDLYDAQRALAQILAAENREMVIDEIFSKFCLGK